MKKLETKSMVLLKHHLKALRMPTMHAECEKVAARCAKDNVDHLGFLLQLIELELIDRERRAAQRRLKAAKFPNYKTLEDFDFVFAIRNEREHYELCEPGSAAADEDSRFMRDRGIFEQPELVPIARHGVHRGDAKRGKYRHSES